MKPLHVVMVLFRYVAKTYVDNDGQDTIEVQLYETEGNVFVVGEDAVEFGPALSPLIPTNFGCYQMMVWSHDCEKVHGSS
ncbi:hypothetical protein HWB51_gp048 [Mycobacterium phage Cuke]|uniref:Uncharacterized protein n=1 Tax=Mycobacterium phage Cuke TaxID=2079417 RepID=A0A2L1IWW7_9CAUD|nr:hypothetical protein HWB51_gp048 [Mycobacterium phage Cuke]AVD99666.1 hypothetical protein SEA_CUKE_48 [Mycobacterium phage Cuke]